QRFLISVCVSGKASGDPGDETGGDEHAEGGVSFHRESGTSSNVPKCGICTVTDSTSSGGAANLVLSSRDLSSSTKLPLRLLLHRQLPPLSYAARYTIPFASSVTTTPSVVPPSIFARSSSSSPSASLSLPAGSSPSASESETLNSPLSSELAICHVLSAVFVTVSSTVMRSPETRSWVRSSVMSGLPNEASELAICHVLSPVFVTVNSTVMSSPETRTWLRSSVMSCLPNEASRLAMTSRVSSKGTSSASGPAASSIFSSASSALGSGSGAA